MVVLCRRSSKVSRCGCGEVGGVANNSIGCSLGECDGDGDLAGCDGAGGVVVAIGVIVGGGVWMTTFGGVGVERLRKFSLAMGE